MYDQLWNLFYRKEIYSFWKEKVKHYQPVNLLKWQNICEFLSVAEQMQLFKVYPPKSYTLAEFLAEFIKVAEDYNYFFTEEEFVWVLIMNKQIWDIFAIAQKTPSLRE